MTGDGETARRRSPIEKQSQVASSTSQAEITCQYFEARKAVIPRFFVRLFGISVASSQIAAAVCAGRRKVAVIAAHDRDRGYDDQCSNNQNVVNVQTVVTSCKS